MSPHPSIDLADGLPPAAADMPDWMQLETAVEVLSRFDRCWHSGFRVHSVDQAAQPPAAVLARPDGSVLPVAISSHLIRRDLSPERDR